MRRNKIANTSINELVQKTPLGFAPAKGVYFIDSTPANDGDLARVDVEPEVDSNISVAKEKK